MADDESRAQRNGQGRAERRRSSRSDSGFDRWLIDQLRKLYDEVLEEEVPDDLVKVVRGFDAQQEGKASRNPKRTQAERAVSPRKPRRARG
jgi:hypothetical protein